jgi:hypothetical protein
MDRRRHAGPARAGSRFAPLRFAPSDVVGDKAGAHADKVQQGAEMAKDAVDKLPEA